MNLPDPTKLAVLTVKEPAAAARLLMVLDLPRGALWSALMLMAVLQAIIFSVSDLLVPGPNPLAEFFGSPLRFCLMIAVALAITVYAIQWAGQLLGGTGELRDILVLLVWLQMLRIAVQIAALVLTLTIPILAALLVLVATIVGLFVLLHFIDQAHGLKSLAAAAGVLFVSVIMIVIGLSIFIAIIGARVGGAAGYV